MTKFIPCIFCDWPIFPSINKYKQEITFNNVDKLPFSEGIAGKITGGYGSKFDTSRFIIAICDICLEQVIQNKKLKNV